MVQNLTYTQYGDYYIPDIRLAHMGIHTLGKYGRMRKAFLEQNKPMLFNDMVLTETLFLHLWEVQQARLFHQKLAADEPMIKINFGNYSAQDALNSLIGSPRGYIGSNKGELPDKLMRSRSKVILIDEFEKASKPVYNFFLQLLEEGKFTDSLGREYDLDKYLSLIHI